MSNKQQVQAAGPPANGQITATVGAVVTAVPAGKLPYAVAFPLPESTTDELDKDTSITFSLKIWDSDTPPVFGQVVKLGGIKLFPHGWRASSAHPVLIGSIKQ